MYNLIWNTEQAHYLDKVFATEVNLNWGLILVLDERSPGTGLTVRVAGHK